MPTYGYHCQTCGKSIDLFQKITDSPITECPHCGKNTLQRGPGGGSAIAFQGSGFYITDYPKGASPLKTSCCPCGKEKTTCSS
ncbi:FmdB family zinc ribbon protein [Estrella lausannensis]|nr:FmdB family zinc ribbon protein [Estrella lausannensis]